MMGRALVTLLLVFGSVAVAYILYRSWRAARAVDDASTIFRDTGNVTETAKRLYRKQITPDADRLSKRQVEFIYAPAIPDRKDGAPTHNGGQQDALTERWNALARFDNEVRAAVEQLRPFGESLVYQLAQAYFALNEDKQYLPKIVQALIEEAERKEAQRWGDRFRITSNGEVCTDTSLNILREAEVRGWALGVERNRTFTATKRDITSYLCSNSDIEQFGRFAGIVPHSPEASCANDLVSFREPVNFPKDTTLYETKGPHVAILSDYSLIMDDGGLGGRAFGVVNKKMDWARTFIEAVETPFGTVVTILFSLALGVGLNILLPPSDSPSARAPASTAPATTSRAAVSAPPAPTPTVPATASRVAVSAPPAPTSTAPATASRTAVSAPPPPTSTASAPDRDEVAALFARGRATLSTGDVAAARVLLRRAAEQNDPQALVALGETYDPAVLKRLGVIKFNPDLAQAREWYRRAADLGSAAAAMRLDHICKHDEERLTRLRASLEREEVVRFENELNCERLRPQVVRLRESISAEGERGDREARQQSQAEQRRPTADAEMQKPEREAAVRSAPSPMPREQICKHDEERLTRLRADLERDEVVRFENELNCERLRPQVVRLRESLGAN
jgi:hypothetical protein